MSLLHKEFSPHISHLMNITFCNLPAKARSFTYFFITICIVFSLAQSGCDSSHSNTDDDVNARNEFQLDKTHPFIGGILCVNRDSLTDGEMEVVVGTVRSQKKPEPAFPPLGNDLFLRRQLMSLRGHHFLEIVGNPNATVTIESSNGTTIRLSNVGKGLYRDVNRTRIEPNTTYSLKVVMEDGTTYSSQLTTLDRHEIITKDDTLFSVIDPFSSKEFPGGVAQFHFRLQPRAKYYTMRRKSSRFSYETLDHSFVSDCSFMGLSPVDSLNEVKYDITHIVSTAYDSAYGRIYMPEIEYSGSDDFMKWYDSNKNISITKRSNILGGNDVLGFFGSISQDKRSYVVLPPKKK